MASNSVRAREAGSAYELMPPSYDAELVSTAKGTSGGELLRRYWHPITLASQVKDLPLLVRLLGEDLILFRTRLGRFGLVYPRCIHRGTTLLYGRVEERGIRCCYHGWLFDTEGRCIEQPCEPGGGLKREQYRQPWYPVEERYGLVFAYLGPLDRKPLLPRYDTLEELDEEHYLVATTETTGQPDIMPCNWFQFYENTVDPWHVFILHSTFSASQFAEVMTIRPEIHWERTDAGWSPTNSASFQTVRRCDGWLKFSCLRCGVYLTRDFYRWARATMSVGRCPSMIRTSRHSVAVAALVGCGPDAHRSAFRSATPGR
jgi:nitrite reductase/ring-hydroxylating ferredoxin subunit